MEKTGRETVQKKSKRHVSTIILFWLLIIVVFTCLATALGAFKYIADSSKEQIMDTLSSYTENDILSFMEAAQDRSEDTLKGIGNVLSMLFEGPDTEDDYTVLNHLLQEWSSTKYLSELSIVEPDGKVVYSNNPNLIGYELWQDGRFEALRPLFEQDSGKIVFYEGVALSDTPVLYYFSARVKDQDYIMLMGVTQEDEDNIINDITEEYLTEDMSLYTVGENGYIFRANEDLVVTASNDHTMIGKTLPELGFPVEKGKEYSQQFTGMLNGEKLFAYGDNTVGFFMFYAFTRAEILQMPTESLKMIMATMSLVCLSIYIGVTVLIRKIVVKNINSLNRSLSRITDGNLDEKVDLRESIEFDALSDDINITVTRLRELIDEASRRIDDELAFASVIQASALPPTSIMSSRSEIALDAYIHPAREVGGDFYDFFMIGRDQLGLVIADVSGKSITAALFMMRSEAMIRERALRGGTPGDILNDVNNSLCEGNESGLFVTVWLAIVDLNTGRGMACNAGHEYPVIRRGSGEFAFLRDEHFPMMGLFDDQQYENYPFELNRGDCIFLYTDGVVEAINKDREQFGEKRTLEALNRDPGASVPYIIHNVRSAIRDFVGEAEQFDDITMLCVEYRGPQA